MLRDRERERNKDGKRLRDLSGRKDHAEKERLRNGCMNE